ncbi:hypothetical protein QBC45DRAFT_330583, partial [Copromyces sp. CBS 386.78]
RQHCTVEQHHIDRRRCDVASDRPGSRLARTGFGRSVPGTSRPFCHYHRDLIRDRCATAVINGKYNEVPATGMLNQTGRIENL